MATLGGRSRPSVAVQALIVVNCVLDPNILINRQQQAAMSPPDASIIGKHAITAPQLSVEDGELVFSSITPFQFSGKSMSTRRALVFTSFNGIPVLNGMSQDAFEDQYMWLGVAHTQTFPEGDPGGMQNGLSVKRAGSGTMLNNSSDMFAPGDLIGYRLPSVDESMRAREVATHTMGRVGSDRWRPNKHVAILEKITYKKMTTVFDAAVAALLDNNRGFSVPQYELLRSGGQVSTLSSTEEIALMIKKSHNWAFWSAIKTMVDKGYITLEQSLAGTTVESQMVSLAAMLGLVKSRTGVDEDFDLQQDFYKRALKASLGTTTTEMKENATQLINRDMYVSPVRAAPSFAQTGKMDTIAEQLVAIANTASKDLTTAYGHSLDRIQHKIVGTSNSFSAPNTSIDYALRP